MKITVVTGVRVICEPPSHVGMWSQTLDAKADRLEEWVREFNDFIRDHKSQNGVTLSVERERGEQCSHCAYEWEVDENGEPVCCETAVAEWRESREVAAA